jgi:hypothetical protein
VEKVVWVACLIYDDVTLLSRLMHCVAPACRALVPHAKLSTRKLVFSMKVSCRLQQASKSLRWRCQVSSAPVSCATGRRGMPNLAAAHGDFRSAFERM